VRILLVLANLLLIFSLSFGVVPSGAPGFAPSNTSSLVYESREHFYVLKDEIRGSSRWAFPQEPLYLNTNELSDDAFHLISENFEIFRIEPTDLKLVSHINRLGHHWLNFQQFHDDLPVEDGLVYFRVMDDGRLWGCGSKAIINFKTKNGKPSISGSKAIDAALSQIPDALEPNSLFNPKLVWFPVKGLGVLAWKIEILGSYPNRYVAYVDAVNSKLIAYWNLVNYFDLYGDVTIQFLPDFYNDTLQIGPFKYGRVAFNYLQTATTDESGHYYIDAWTGGTPFKFMSWVKGLYVDVQLMGGADAQIDTQVTPPTEFSWLWNTDRAQTDELNLYYHITFIHDYFKELDPDFENLDYPVPARARNPYMTANAYWDGYAVNFGAGIPGEVHNFALFSAVIYHEYSHGVTMHIYRPYYFPYIGESGAMNEAFSDYFPLSILGYPYMGWHVTTSREYFRSLENDLLYPDNIVNEPHYDSRIISAAFWEIRAGVLHTIGKGWSDTVIHFTRYSGANTFDDFALETFFTADDDGNIENGCPNFSLIANSYARHGIGPGYYPNLIARTANFTDISDGDGFFEPGESMLCSTTVIFDNPESRIPSFIFPDIDTVFVKIENNDPDFWVEESVITITSLSYKDSVSICFTLHAADSIIPHVSKLILAFESPNGLRRKFAYFNFEIGSPQILVVMGSDTPDELDFWENYYREALRKLPSVFDFLNATTSPPSYSDLSEYPAVLWYTGNGKNSLTADNLTALSDYLDAGGNVILTGQDGFDSTGYSDWLSTYFGGVIDKDSARVQFISGVAGEIFGSGFVCNISSGTGARNQISPNTLIATSGNAILKYLGSGDRVAAVKYDSGTYKTVLFGFGLEALPMAGSPLALPEALRKMFEWFGINIYSEIWNDVIMKPTSIDLDVYPNPFNSSVSIKFNGCGNYCVSIFDLTGRNIWFSPGFANGITEVVWFPEKENSGIYLVKLDIDNYSVTKKVILVR